jgi:hypothetical protein
MSPASRKHLTRSNAAADVSKPAPLVNKQSHPLVKRLGRPPKPATAAAASASEAKDAVETSEYDQPSKVTEANIHAPSSPAPAQPEKTDPPKPALRILPDRKRDPHPGAIVKGTTRRTSAQVAADSKRANELKQSLAELAQRKVEILVEMEVQQQMDDDNDEQRVIKTIADAESLERRKKFEASADESSSDGETDIDDDDAMAVSDDDGISRGKETQAAPLKIAARYFP